ncbi:right-handed parallel beta-helix repeat-containing protein [Mucilaginibacter lutimaris]|uniref:Right-handed parallel beta-helix repeat-containing protein n=1 Tax=Mucilaginibacter lutimaris TaxID=931629 RepID=A0ABW2ZKW9_9SPHI
MRNIIPVLQSITNKPLMFKLVFLSFVQFMVFSCKKDIVSINNNANKVTDQVNGVTLNGSDIAQVKDAVVLTAGTDGGDKTALIQSAFNTGKPVILKKGIYLIKKPIVRNSGNLSLTGEDAVILLDPSFPAIGKYTAAFVLSNLSALSVQGIAVDGNRGKLSNAGSDWTNYIMAFNITNSANINLINCHSLNASSISYNLENCKAIDINSCSSVNAMYHGISLQYCSNAKVSNCKITGIGNQGVNINKGGIGILATGGDNITINNNFIENMSDTGTKTEGCNYVTWVGNTVNNSGKDGLKFQNLVGADQVHGNHPQIKTVYHAKIYNNTINKIFNGRNDGSALIQVMGAEDVAVLNNKITGGGKKGQEDGISVVTNTNINAKKVLIQNNSILNTNRFIYLSSTSYVNVSNNICTNAITPLTPYNGFTAENSDQTAVKNNTFQRSSTGSIDGFAASFYDCSNFSLINNKLLNAFTGLSARLVSARADTIANNQMNNFGSYGVSIYSAKPGTIISNLLITNNIITKMGMKGGLGWMFKIDPANMIIDKLDLSGTKVLGNGNNGDWAISIKGAQNIKDLILTDFYSDGNAAYPSQGVIAAAINIIGWKSSAKPSTGYWALNTIVYNTNLTSPILGWKCTKAGTPGTWIELMR